MTWSFLFLNNTPTLTWSTISKGRANEPIRASTFRLMIDNLTNCSWGARIVFGTRIDTLSVSACSIERTFVVYKTSDGKGGFDRQTNCMCNKKFKVKHAIFYANRENYHICLDVYLQSVHAIFGLPVNPGKHLQVAEWRPVSHFALFPQFANRQALMQLPLLHTSSYAQSSCT